MKKIYTMYLLAAVLLLAYLEYLNRNIQTYATHDGTMFLDKGSQICGGKAVATLVERGTGDIFKTCDIETNQKTISVHFARKTLEVTRE